MTSASASASSPAPNTAAPVATRGVVSVRVKSGKVVGPTKLQPGSVRIRNAGKRSIYLYRTRGSGLRTFVREFNSPSPTGLTRKFVAVDHFFAEVSIDTVLTSGTYYLADGDGDPGSLKKSTVLTIKVAGTRVNTPAPANAQPIAIAANEKLDAPTSLSSSRALRITLAGRTTRVLYAARVGSVSKQTIAKFVNDPGDKTFDKLRTKKVIQLAYADGPATLYTTFSAASGRYVVYNVAYKPSGKEIFERGQVRQVRVV